MNEHLQRMTGFRPIVLKNSLLRLQIFKKQKNVLRQSRYTKKNRENSEKTEYYSIKFDPNAQHRSFSTEYALSAKNVQTAALVS